MDNLWENQDFLDWYNSRPPIIQNLIKKFPPNKYYKVQGGMFKGRLYSYSEDGTMTVDIDSPIMPRRVFGLKPEDLEEWYDL